jgi:hypothetical protein
MNRHRDAAQQPDESLRSFLERRERELTHQLAALRGQVESKRGELAEIQRVRATLAPPPPSPPDTSSFERAADDIRAAANRPRIDLMQQADNPPLAPSPPSPPDTSSFERTADDIRAAANRRRADLMQQAGNPPLAVPSSNEKLTIKSMILTALNSHFDNGATPAELRTFIKDVFGREIDRTSMSPQLARLRENGAIEQVDMKWRLSERARQRGVANYLQPQNPEDT